MKKIKNNTKAFTLIELLAVIVILGVLMMAAIPAVTSAITRSRRNTFASNAKEIIASVRTAINSGEAIEAGTDGSAKTPHEECQFPPRKGLLKVAIDNSTLSLLLERGSNKSSFGRKYETAYVYIYNKSEEDAQGDYYDYFIYLVDNAKNGIDIPTHEDDINGSMIKIAKATSTDTTAVQVTDDLTIDMDGTLPSGVEVSYCTLVNS